MATAGFSRTSPFVFPAGPLTPAQRTHVEHSFLSTTYPITSPDGSGFKWNWVETRTFPDTGHTYDVVSATSWIGDAYASNQFWFDVTDALTPAERNKLVARTLTAPVIAPASQAIRSSMRPAGQSSSDSGIIPIVTVIAVLASFMAFEIFTRPKESLLPPPRRLRKSVKLPSEAY